MSGCHEPVDLSSLGILLVIIVLLAVAAWAFGWWTVRRWYR